jgi:hypothetical protein
LTCRTLGEAIACVAEHGQGAGALLHHRYTVEGKLFSIEVTPRLYDTDLEPYLNISERTLRRRLADLNVSYRSLVDQARHERAVESATPNVRLAQRDRTCHRLQRRTELSAGVQALDRDAPWRLPSWLFASGNSGRTCIERVTPVQGFKGASFKHPAS